MKIIIKDVNPDDWILAIRAARWLLDLPDTKDSILAYGEGLDEQLKHFYVKRNKTSITVRPC